jgi:hypothetical protein
MHIDKSLLTKATRAGVLAASQALALPAGVVGALAVALAAIEQREGGA